MISLDEHLEFIAGLAARVRHVFFERFPIDFRTADPNLAIRGDRDDQSIRISGCEVLRFRQREFAVLRLIEAIHPPVAAGDVDAAVG
ncbi:MAG: hypothetical protein WED34_17520, partial [Planctomycetales bacterium]